MTNWSEYRHYCCRKCGEICINHRDLDRTSVDLCDGCYQQYYHNEILEVVEEHLDQQPAPTITTSERAEGAAPSHGGPTDRESARPRAERRGQSQRESPAEGPERGVTIQSVLKAVQQVDE
ncbi:hypothetical protein [Haloarcula hispanica]|uniref:hypothetical protein n=1 Tax=Haloarcula hispanica TaxID=51589 RepID=UPI00164979BD|nr:hypothetical protein [Haloarcula hispanica]